MNTNDHDSRLEEVAAYALGALDAERIDDFREHLKGCERCQQELRYFAPAVRALPEAVEQQKPSPELKVRLMEEVRADAEAAAARAEADERRERSATRKSFGQWLDGLRLGGLGWKPLAGMAAVVLVVAAGIGYAVGNGGGTNLQTTEVEQQNGIVAKVVAEDGKGELRLTGLGQVPKGKTLEAWVQRGKSVEPVKELFVPDGEGNATTHIEDLGDDVDAVLVTQEPAGGTKVPTTKPFVDVPLES